MLSLKEIRKNIILKDGLFYFDYTASGLAYNAIENEILSILPTYANTHSDHSGNSVITQKLYDKSRKSIKKSLNINDDFYIFACGYGSTAAIKKFQEILGIYVPPYSINRYKIQPSNMPLVIVGPYEHHSNEVSFRQALCEVKRIGLDENFGINFKELEEILKLNSKREIIATFSLASNVSGVISDYKKLYKLVKKYGGILALDAASYSAYKNADCNYYDAMFLSPHKLLGGVGSCGILILKKDLYKQSEPSFAGGGSVIYVDRSSHYFVDDPLQLEESGTPPILGLIRAALAYKLRNKIGLNFIEKVEKTLNDYFIGKISQIEEIVNYTPFNLERLPIFAMNIKGISPYEFSFYLSSKYGIQTRAGCACAGPYGHDILGLSDNTDMSLKPGFLRIGLHFSHSKKDIDYLVKSVKNGILNFKNKKLR